MAHNRTLGDFTAGGDDGPTPIEPVQQWTPDPVPCPRCGQERQVLWIEPGQAGRCADCKEW